MKKAFADRGYDPMGGGPQAFAAYMDKEIALWAKVVKASGATVN